MQVLWLQGRSLLYLLLDVLCLATCHKSHGATQKHTMGYMNEIWKSWGAWVAQSVKCLTLAQVMMSQFMGLSPTSGSVLTAQSLEPASDSVSPSLSLSLSLSAPPLLTLCLFFSVSKIKINTKIFFK